MARPSMIVTGTTLNPMDISSSYASGSSSTFRTVNVCRSRESNSFTWSHARQCEPLKSVMLRVISLFYACDHDATLSGVTVLDFTRGAGDAGAPHRWEPGAGR